MCAGQEPKRDLHDALQSGGPSRARLFMIGGAHEAGELDAKRAIDQGTRYYAVHWGPWFLITDMIVRIDSPIRLAAVIENAKEGDVYDAPVELKQKVRLVLIAGYVIIFKSFDAVVRLFSSSVRLQGRSSDILLKIFKREYFNLRMSSQIVIASRIALVLGLHAMHAVF